MKKVLTLLLICLPLLSIAQDTTKNIVQKQITTIDTSSTFKQIYSDVKSGIVAIASALKIGAEHVYEVLVRQQVVNAIVYVLCAIFSFLFGMIGYKESGKIEFDDDNNPKEVRPLVVTVGFVFISVVLGSVFLFHLDNITMGFINPEYGAIKEIIDFAK